MRMAFHNFGSTQILQGIFEDPLLSLDPWHPLHVEVRTKIDQPQPLARPHGHSQRTASRKAPGGALFKREIRDSVHKPRSTWHSWGCFSFLASSQWHSRRSSWYVRTPSCCQKQCITIWQEVCKQENKIKTFKLTWLRVSIWHSIFQLKVSIFIRESQVTLLVGCWHNLHRNYLEVKWCDNSTQSLQQWTS